MPLSGEEDDLDFMQRQLPKCPHCGADFPIWDDNHPLSLNYDDGAQTDLSCTSCGEDFVAVTVVRYEFSTAANEENANDELWGPAGLHE